MTKKTKQFITLAGSLVLLAGVYGGARLVNYVVDKRNEEKEAEEEAANTFYLSEMEQPLNLTYTNEYGTFSFTYDSDEETWSYDGDEHFPVTQSYLTTLAGDMKSLVAERRLDEVDEDRSIYGLDEPSYSITVKDDDNEITVNIGDKNSYSGDYYAEVEGSDEVYTVAKSLVTAAGYSLDDLLEKESFPYFASTSISYISLSDSAGEISFASEVTMEPVTEEETSEESAESDSEEESESGSEAENSAAEETTKAQTDSTKTSEEETESEYEEESTQELVEVTTWTRSDASGGQVVEDTTDLDTAISNITALEFVDCADYYADEDELSAFGLGEEDDIKTITFTYTSSGEEVTATLKIGGLDDDGTNYYVQMNDSDAVNTMDAESLDAILAFFEE